MQKARTCRREQLGKELSDGRLQKLRAEVAMHGRWRTSSAAAERTPSGRSRSSRSSRRRRRRSSSSARKEYGKAECAAVPFAAPFYFHTEQTERTAQHTVALTLTAHTVELTDPRSIPTAFAAVERLPDQVPQSSSKAVRLTRSINKSGVFIHRGYTVSTSRFKPLKPIHHRHLDSPSKFGSVRRLY